MSNNHSFVRGNHTDYRQGDEQCFFLCSCLHTYECTYLCRIVNEEDQDK